MHSFALLTFVLESSACPCTAQWGLNQDAIIAALEGAEELPVGIGDLAPS